MDSRPPPPQGAPPSYAFVTRVYKRSLRPVVLAIAFLAGLWTLFGAIGYFRNAAFDRLGSVPKLKIVYIIIGTLYMLVTASEGLGLVAAATQRTPLVRIYAYLSALSTLVIIGTGLLRIIVHFTMKNDLIKTCTTATAGDTIVYFGFWGPVYRDLSENDAQFWCQRAWEHDSWQEIVAFLITSFLAFFFSAIAFSYLRQLLDPSSPANFSRAPSAGFRNNNFNQYYNQPYAGGEQPYYGPGGFLPPYPAPKSEPPNYIGEGREDSKGSFDHPTGSGSRPNAAA